MAGALPYQRNAVGANFPMITKGCLVRLKPGTMMAMFSGKETFLVISDTYVGEQLVMDPHTQHKEYKQDGTVGAIGTADGITHRLFIADLEVISGV